MVWRAEMSSRVPHLLVDFTLKHATRAYSDILVLELISVRG
jgi:hypothetical protein